MTEPYMSTRVDKMQSSDLSAERIQVREPISGTVLEVAVDSPQAQVWERVDTSSKPRRGQQ